MEIIKYTCSDFCVKMDDGNWFKFDCENDAEKFLSYMEELSDNKDKFIRDFQKSVKKYPSWEDLWAHLLFISWKGELKTVSCFVDEYCIDATDGDDPYEVLGRCFCNMA